MRTAAAALTVALAVVATGARADLIEVVAAPAPLATVRSALTLTALPGEKALLAGGTYTASAEVYNFNTKAWTKTAPMSVPRAQHGAARLPDGRVIVVGGVSNSIGAPLKSAEIYDPASRTWSTTAPSAFGHVGAIAVDEAGRVGALSEEGALTGSFEIYDPASNTWTTRTVPLYKHSAHSIEPLADGFLVIGGGAVAERYQSTTNGWLALPALIEARKSPALVTLADGRVVIVGGGLTGAGAGVVVFNPKDNGIVLSGGVADRRGVGAAAVLLPDGRALMVGASSPERSSGVPMTIDVFDPATSTSSALATMILGPVVAAPSGKGHVLVVSDAATTAFVVNVPGRCTLPSDCASGFCADGVCCDTACNGQCEACDVAGSSGVCSAVDGAPHGARPTCSPPWTPPCRASTCDRSRSRTACVEPLFKPVCTCSRDSDCESGHCTDGVCCNTACDGQCESCDMPGSRGTCSPVRGEPRGIRKGCPVPGRGICTVQACNGREPKQCVFVNASETSCDSICAGRVQRHCDGQGDCGLPHELKCPDNSCTTAAPEPTERPRFLDALLVMGLAAVVGRYRKKRS